MQVFNKSSQDIKIWILKNYCQKESIKIELLKPELLSKVKQSKKVNSRRKWMELKAKNKNVKMSMSNKKVKFKSKKSKSSQQI